MNVPTSEFRALSDQAARVDEYRRREALLFRAMEMLLDGSPDLQSQAEPARPQLRVIKGGRR